MEKTILIDNKEVRFKSTAATPLRYKAQFHKDFVADIMKLHSLSKVDPENLSNIEGLDFEVFYNITWVLAKTADPSIPDPITWLDGFEEFPLLEIMPELQYMVMSTMQGKKK